MDINLNTQPKRSTIALLRYLTDISPRLPILSTSSICPRRHTNTPQWHPSPVSSLPRTNTQNSHQGSTGPSLTAELTILLAHPVDRSNSKEIRRRTRSGCQTSHKKRIKVHHCMCSYLQTRRHCRSYLILALVNHQFALK